ncbi:MAG: hypothetical protein JNL10_05915 [Verrucomicrobiales bacterium]|nr:hypothetical protein [Verrucomicrobiales bacterium]
MMDPLLHARLRPLLWRLRQRRFAAGLAGCWMAVAALAGVLGMACRAFGWTPRALLPAAGVAAVAAGVWTVRRLWKSRPGWAQLAGAIERGQPALKGLLLTAVQQEESAGRPLNVLQRRVVLSAVRASHQGGWRQFVPLWQVAGAHVLQVAAGVAMLAALWSLRAPGTTVRNVLTLRPAFEVTPGDVALEKGSSLVVLARFGVAAPARAELVLKRSGEPERRVALVRSLSDPVYGASIPEVAADFTYRVDYDGQTSRDYRVTVYEHPRLERSDAELNYPDYTALPRKRVEDTRQVGAVEGTRLDLTLSLNKPVVSARLVGRTNSPGTLVLEVGTNLASAYLRGWTLTNSGRYDLVLVDGDGRTNKVPTTFVLDALPNRPPEFKLTAPRGDTQPSALEEVAFAGTVWDDFGVPRFGLSYRLAAGEPRSIELGKAVPGREKRSFQQLVRLEDLGVHPDDLVAWNVWAEDIGPDGQVRRTEGDLYFAEVRPFEEIFREAESPSGDSQQQQQQQQGTPATRLAELQKQILAATWNLQRTRGAKSDYASNAVVVRDSQSVALDRAKSEKNQAEEDGRPGEWNTVIKAMGEAVDHMEEAAGKPAALAQAVVSEQAALQALMRMSVRETSVSRGRNRGQGTGQSASQRQLDQLDLKQEEDRYETQRQAQAGQNSEQREELQILNRLRELARRQQDLNERMKEVQTALEEARTEEEREEARRQLKRLEEEQREMLAGIDELRQRMDRPENQSRMSEQRQRLEETREELQKAAEAADQGSTGRAVSSGTRAQRQLEEMRDDLRKESASQFSEELRQLRQDARELARKQDEVRRTMEGAASPSGPKSLSESPERREAAEQLARQRGALTNLIQRATEVSQKAEEAEPLVSQKLYDTLRKFQQEDSGAVKSLQQELAERGQLTQRMYEHLQETSGQGGQTLEMAAELLRQGGVAQADRVEQRARGGIGQFRDGVEQAAESVLGDDTEALRRAAGELDALTSELQREIARDSGESPDPSDASAPGDGAARRTGASPRDSQGRTADAREPGSEGARENATPPERPGPNGSPGEEPASQPGRQPGPGSEAGANARSETAASTPPTQSPGSGPGGARSPQARTPGGANRGTAGTRAGVNLQDLAGGGNEGETSRGQPGGPGPLTGGNFAPWSDRLREVEEIVDSPELRAGVAGARERARLMRLEYRRDLKKPDWATVRLEVLKPLVEVRQQIAEELARRGSRDALVPIDRDPVPTRYTELVRKYYEELGKDR